MTDRLAEHDQADLAALLDTFDALTGEAKLRLMDFPAIYWKLSRLAARRSPLRKRAGRSEVGVPMTADRLAEIAPDHHDLVRLVTALRLTTRNLTR